MEIKIGEVVEMITLLEDIAQHGLKDTKLYIMKTTDSFVISIPKINWSTEISNAESPHNQFDHLLHSLTFHMFEGDCSQLAESITSSISKYETS
ncbi:YueH family protein [Niallia circulans]